MNARNLLKQLVVFGLAATAASLAISATAAQGADLTRRRAAQVVG